MDNQNERTFKYLIAHKNNLWMGVIVLVGGVVGLMISLPKVFIDALNYIDIIKIVLIIVGFYFIYTMLMGLIDTDSLIRKNLKEK